MVFKELINETKLLMEKGSVVRFLLSSGAEMPPKYLIGKILYYPKSRGFLPIRKSIEGDEDNKKIVFSKVPTVMIKHLNSNNVFRVDVDCIDKSSVEALKIKFNSLKGGDIVE